MYSTDTAAERTTWVIVLAANAILVALIVASPSHPIYDEIPYLAYLNLLHQDGLSVTFLRDYPGPAGPLHTFIYDAAIRVTHLPFPYLRLVSYALLLASASLFARVAREIVPSAGAPHAVGGSLLGAIFSVLPTVAVSSGMTLTEVPAMSFVGVFLLALVWTISASSPLASFIYAAAAGAALGLAVLGQQNYLAVLPCLLMLLIPTHGNSMRQVAPVCVLGVVTIAVVGPVFLIWGGIIPPKLAAGTPGISLWHGILAMGYAGIITFLIAPEIMRGTKWLLVVASVIALAIWALMSAGYMPMHTVASLVLGQATAQILVDIFDLLICFLATFFLACMLAHLWDNSKSAMMLFFGSVALVGLATNIKNTYQFSSRYVFVFLPFVLLSVAPSMRLSWHLPIRIAIGASVGLISLSSYLFWQ